MQLHLHTLATLHVLLFYLVTCVFFKTWELPSRKQESHNDFATHLDITTGDLVSMTIRYAM